jgi:hypothetical protein
VTVPKAAADPSDPTVVGPATLGGRLRPRHWAGIGALAGIVIVAALLLPALIMTGGGGRSRLGVAAPDSSPAAGSAPTGLAASSAAPDLSRDPMLTATTDTGTPPPRGTPPPTGTPGPAGASTAPGAFEPLGVQAEDPASTLVGSAAVTDCELCEGGARVRYIDANASVTLHFAVPSAGDRQITVFYEVDGRRTLKASVNGGKPVTTALTGTSWSKPSSYSFVATVPAGPVNIRFYNDDSPAPDIDKVVLS